MPTRNNVHIIEKLRRDIMHLEGFKPASSDANAIDGLQQIERSFPNHVFPTGAVHEFLTFKQEHVASTAGFVAGIMSVLMKNDGACLWISTNRKIFPRAFASFNVQPDKIVFVNVRQYKHALWAAEEALKCKAVATVIVEIPELTFVQSRRLQLAVEHSNVTGLVLRTDAKKLCTTTCVARWEVKPIASQLEDGMPGVGFPRWNVSLLKVRNGKPGNWIVEWCADKYTIIEQQREQDNIRELVQRAG
jgi:protein ImuA